MARVCVCVYVKQTDIGNKHAGAKQEVTQTSANVMDYRVQNNGHNFASHTDFTDTVSRQSACYFILNGASLGVSGAISCDTK
jgi:hypothetical protein